MTRRKTQMCVLSTSKSFSQGFALVEMLVALAISGIVLSSIYAVFTSQSRSYDIQTQIVDLQQSLRSSMRTMEWDLRQTGYNPGDLTEGRASTDGIDNNCNGTTDEVDNTTTLLVDESEAIAFKVALPNKLTISQDLDGDGVVCADKERVTYELNGTTLEKNTRPLSENIEVLNFVYLDEDAHVVTSIGEVRSVQITLVGRTKFQDREYRNNQSYFNLQGNEILSAQNDGYRRRVLTSQVYSRNLKE